MPTSRRQWFVVILMGIVGLLVLPVATEHRSDLVIEEALSRPTAYVLPTVLVTGERVTEPARIESAEPTEPTMPADSAELAEPTRPSTPPSGRASIEAGTKVWPLPASAPAARGLAGEVIVDLRAGQLARRSVHAYVDSGEVFVPAKDLFAFLEILATVDSDGRFHAEVLPEGREILIDPPAGRAWAGGNEIPEEFVKTLRTEDGLYVGPELVHELLDFRIRADLGELTYAMEPVDHTPLGRRIAREEARANLLAKAAPLPPETHVPVSFKGLHGATIDWTVQVADLDGLSVARHGLTLGANVLGGGLTLSYLDRQASVAGEPTATLDGSWVRAWPEQKLIRQIRLGTVTSFGPRPRQIRGAAISNSPYLRPEAFGETPLVGRLPVGWEVEVYRSGELVDFRRVDTQGIYELSLPVDYGINSFEVQAYGPNGVMETLSRPVRIGRDRLPSGHLEYEVSLGEVRNHVGEQRGSADLRYGLSRNWTVRTGLEAYQRKSAPDLAHPYGVVSGAVKNGWLVRGEVVGNAFASVALGYEPSMDFRTSVTHSVFDTKVVAPVLHATGLKSRSQLGLFWRHDTARRSFFTQFDGSRTVDIARWRTQANLRVTTQVAGIRWTGQWVESRTSFGSSQLRTATLGLTGSSVLKRSRNWLTSGLYLRGSAFMNAESRSFERASLGLGRDITKRTRLEFDSTWRSSDRSPSFSVGITVNGSAFRNHTQVGSSSGGQVSGVSRWDGSVVYNETIGRLEAYPYRSTGRGGLAGQVYVDANANGLKDPGEKAVSGLQLRSNDKLSKTDEEGRYSLWNLTPFEHTQVEFVPATLQNPLLVPKSDNLSMEVGPNGFRELNLPMVKGVEVMGALLRDGTTEPWHSGGLQVVFEDTASGKRTTTHTFHDGSFYFLSLTPGVYHVLVGGESGGTQLSVAPQSAHQVIPAEEGEAGVVELRVFVDLDGVHAPH